MNPPFAFVWRDQERADSCALWLAKREISSLSRLPGVESPVYTRRIWTLETEPRWHCFWKTQTPGPHSPLDDALQGNNVRLESRTLKCRECTS